jgi:hypothetical protein
LFHIIEFVTYLFSLFDFRYRIKDLLLLLAHLSLLDQCRLSLASCRQITSQVACSVTKLTLSHLLTDIVELLLFFQRL